jgi:hypothetical protein
VKLFHMFFSFPPKRRGLDLLGIKIRLSVEWYFIKKTAQLIMNKHLSYTFLLHVPTSNRSSSGTDMLRQTS